MLKEIKFNTVFAGAAYINKEGAYSVQMSDAQVIQTAATHASQMIVVAENYKFNKKAPARTYQFPANKSTF